ncbi:unnamed protein product [Calypogeia fissa]
MTIPEEVRSKWCDALYQEDSLEVLKLLKSDPHLLMVGWGSEAAEMQWKGKPWKERTALHVGVKRGNADLVEHVLMLCKVDIVKHTQVAASEPQLSQLAEIEESRRNDNNEAVPSQSDDTTREGDRRQPANSAAARLAEGFQKSPSTNDTHPTEKAGSRSAGRSLRKAASSVISRSKRDWDDDKSQEIAGPSQEDTTREGGRQTPNRTRSASSGLGNKRLLKSLSVSYGGAVKKITGRAGADRSKHEGVGRSQEIARRAIAKWKHEVEDRRYENILRRLLMAKDGEYHVDATAIAFLHCNKKIVLMLLYAIQKYDLYKCPEGTLPALDVIDESKENKGHRDELRKAMEQVVHSFEPQSIAAEVLAEYRKHLDFNFLPWEEYLFHFLLTTEKKEFKDFTRVVWTAIRSCSDSTWRYLLELQDAQGRTPLHVSVDYVPANFYTLVANLLDEEVLVCALTARDGAGRTAVHRGYITGKDPDVGHSLGFEFYGQIEIRGQVHHSIPKLLRRWIPELELDNVSKENGFQSINDKTGEYRDRDAGVQRSVLQSAILHRQLESEDWMVIGDWIQMACSPENLGSNDLFPWIMEWDRDDWRETKIGAVELAVLVGDANNLKRFLQCFSLGIYGLFSPSSERSHEMRPWPALHIAACLGNYEMVKTILDNPYCDPYEEDWDENGALHHALNVTTIVKVEPHLLDYVNCEHIVASRGKVNTNMVDDEALTQRQGCINLLLQAGCDVFKTNDNGQPPYPQGTLSSNSKFVSWWYERQAKEFDATQRTLSSAANAISVTATLVATASYVGPLQPPMGIAGDPSQIQDANFWVRIFIFCDTMSFYFAIVAITLSLIPSIPVPQQTMKDEVQRTRWMVAMSLTILFPSIIFVLVAFVSSSIAVVSADVTATGGWLTITTASIGGFFCLLTFTLFFFRLLAFIFPRNKQVRKVYDATNWKAPI